MSLVGQMATLTNVFVKWLQMLFTGLNLDAGNATKSFKIMEVKSLLLLGLPSDFLDESRRRRILLWLRGIGD